MEIRGVKLTPSILGIFFGVLLLAMSGVAGFWVPGGPLLGVESASSGNVSAPPPTAVPATAAPRIAAASSPTRIPTTVPTPRPSPTATTLPTPTITPTVSSNVSYTIKQGDTLSEVAGRYGVTVDSIVRYNGLRSADDLHIGDKITIPTGPAPASTPASSPLVVYTIKEGDTISAIADRYGVTADAIVRYNGLRSPDDLRIGDKITIPPQ